MLPDCCENSGIAKKAFHKHLCFFFAYIRGSNGYQVLLREKVGCTFECGDGRCCLGTKMDVIQAAVSATTQSVLKRTFGIIHRTPLAFS